MSIRATARRRFLPPTRPCSRCRSTAPETFRSASTRVRSMYRWTTARTTTPISRRWPPRWSSHLAAVVPTSSSTSPAPTPTSTTGLVVCGSPNRALGQGPAGARCGAGRRGAGGDRVGRWLLSRSRRDRRHPHRHDAHGGGRLTTGRRAHSSSSSAAASWAVALPRLSRLHGPVPLATRKSIVPMSARFFMNAINSPCMVAGGVSGGSFQKSWK